MEEHKNIVIGTVTMDTSLADAIKEVPEYDVQAKNFLKEKEVLSVILQDCVVEFKGVLTEDIARKFIEGTPLVSEVYVDPDADISSAFQQSSGSKIQGAANEDKTRDEGQVTYDIHFTALAPKSGRLIKLIINVESQKKYNTGYPMINRAVYYASRLISAQKNVEFKNDEYQNLKKVYSIWIILNPPKWMENKIICIDMYPHLLHDEEHFLNVLQDDCRIISIVFIGVGAPDSGNLNNTLKMLTAVLSTDLTFEDKKDRLSALGMSLTEEVKRTVENMSGLGYGILEKGYDKGYDIGRAEGKAEGIGIGEARGRLHTFYDVVNNKLISPDVAAAQLNISLVDFEDGRKEYNLQKKSC